MKGVHSFIYYSDQLNLHFLKKIQDHCIQQRHPGEFSS